MNYFSRSAALPALLCSSITLAQTTLDTLVVTGTRTESAAVRLADTVTVIDRATIEASQADSLAELLSSRAGIEVLDYYGDGSRNNVSLRGFGENAASNALILIDGQPLNQPDIGGPDLGRIRLEDIERVEVLDGGSALWGNQAVGGVIHIVTRSGKSSGASISRGAFEQLDLSAHAGFGGEIWQLGLRGSEWRSDNYRDNNQLERQSLALSASLASRLATLKFRLDHSDETLQLPGGLFASEAAQDRRQSASDFQGDFSALKTLNLAADLRADLGNSWQFDGHAALYDSDGDFKISFRGFPADPASQTRRVRSFNPQWSWHYHWNNSAGHIALGADIQRADYRLQSQFGIQRNEQSIDDLYLSGLVPVSPSLDLSLALRQSRISDQIADPGPFAVLPNGQRFGHEETVGSAGLSWRLSPSLSLVAGWDQVLRYPKVDEYFGSGFTPDTIGLQPQTGQNHELGLRLNSSQLSGTLLFFRLNLEQEIVYDPGSFSNTNLEKTQRQGVSLNAQWTLHPRLSVEFSGSALDSDIDGASRIPLVAEQHGQIGLHLMLGSEWKLMTQLQGASDRLAGGDTDDSASHLPGYGVLNVALRWQRSGVNLGLKLANALDKKYAAVGFEDGFTGEVARFPLPGAHGKVSLSIDF